MVMRILAVFLVICLVAIYAVNSFVAIKTIDFSEVVSLDISQPDSPDLTFQVSDPGDKTALERIVNWYNAGETIGLALNPKVEGYNVLTWTLKKGKYQMYAPKEFPGYLLVKDTKLPMAYKIKVGSSKDLEKLKVFSPAP